MRKPGNPDVVSRCYSSASSSLHHLGWWESLPEVTAGAAPAVNA